MSASQTIVLETMIDSTVDCTAEPPPETGPLLVLYSGKDGTCKKTLSVLKYACRECFIDV